MNAFCIRERCHLYTTFPGHYAQIVFFLSTYMYMYAGQNFVLFFFQLYHIEHYLQENA